MFFVCFVWENRNFRLGLLDSLGLYLVRQVLVVYEAREVRPTEIGETYQPPPPWFLLLAVGRRQSVPVVGRQTLEYMASL